MLEALKSAPLLAVWLLVELAECVRFDKLRCRGGIVVENLKHMIQHDSSLLMHVAPDFV